MVCKQPGHGPGALVFVAMVGVLCLGGTQTIEAAPIAWERSGPFQSCLEARLQTWVRTKAELFASESPDAGDLDDLDVAMWTVEALQSCEAQVGRGDQTAELRFGRHMARWREHINDLVEDIRRRGRPD